MALDRRTIERRDFPTARQGYDKAAVDAHLRAIADEHEHSGQSGHAATIAGSASERVRAIVEAAETSAALIEREAHQAATATRQSAEQFARDAREGAGQVAEVIARLVEQLEQSRRRLDELVVALSGERATEDPRATPAEPAAPPAPAPEPQSEPPPEPPAASPDAGATEGARLIALDMALSGSSRAETAKYLDENFNLPDRDQVLDEVYAKLGEPAA